MTRIGERLPSVAVSNASAVADVRSARAFVDLLGSVISAQGAAPVAAARYYATESLGPSTAVQQAAHAKEVLPSLLGVLTDERLARCIDEAYRETFQGDRWPRGPERSQWLGFARELRAKDPKITAEQVRSAIANELRLQRDGLDVATPENIDLYIREAISWVSWCYEGNARSATEDDMRQWRAFAAEKKRENPDIQPEDLKYAIIDAVRAKVTKMDSTSPENVDRFIEDAVKWVTLCYQGEERCATPAEMTYWRAFAAEKLREDPEMSPEALKYAITDTLRAKMTGTDSTSPENIDRFIDDAVRWVSLCYEGRERHASPAELAHWRAFANAELAENPKVAPEELRNAITDAIRAQALGVETLSPAHIDRYIMEAIGWVSLCYLGTSRAPTSEELQRWRAFAAEKLKDDPELTPETLKYAISDAVRNELTGMSKPAELNIDRFIREAYEFLFHAYRGMPADMSRQPTPREMHEWRQFARARLRAEPKLSSEELNSYLLDSLRTALSNQ
ncbi:hypothetical protein [Myxococcus sp. Y35]|uniref:hypothetical protein n=1 Tax=Pseudomyxococcus flavus TaxID=3115648 RepID=UPI003CF5DAD0